MKNILILLSCLLLLMPAKGQQFEVGLSTGAMKTFIINKVLSEEDSKTITYQYDGSQNANWSKGFYLEYHVNQKLSLAVNHYHYNYRQEYFYANQYGTSYKTWGSSINNVGIMAQYKILNKGKLNYAVGVNLSMQLSKRSGWNYYYDPITKIITNNSIISKHLYTGGYIGINQELSYRLNNKITLNSLLLTQMSTMDALTASFKSFSPATRGNYGLILNLSVGCGYTF